MINFVKALFDEKNQIDFKYKDYKIALYAGEFHSYYLLSFLQSEEEMMNFWRDTVDIFQQLKSDTKIYSVDMEKNMMCVYCLEVSEDDYYQAEATGTIGELSKKISQIEEDLDYFAKHVFLYTHKMDSFSEKHVGKFEDLCTKYLRDEEFSKYKANSRTNYEYDFLINLFIKFPFLHFERFQIQNGKEYQSVESFVEDKLRDKSLDMNLLRKEMEQIEEVVEDNSAFYAWLDSFIESVPVAKEENS